MDRGYNTSQGVRCLTTSKEELMVYIPHTLPHDKAVQLVENILEVFVVDKLQCLLDILITE